MVQTEVDDCYRALGLAPNAPWERVRTRYRRLLFDYHPDRTGDDAAALARYASVARAYRALSTAIAQDGSLRPMGRCAACGELTSLYRAPDGNGYCGVCAVDGRGRRGLPSPPIAVVSCLGIILGLVAAGVLLISAWQTGSVGQLVASLLLNTVSVGWLMVLCLSIRYTLTRQERQRIART